MGVGQIPLCLRAWYFRFVPGGGKIGPWEGCLGSNAGIHRCLGSNAGIHRCLGSMARFKSSIASLFACMKRAASAPRALRARAAACSTRCRARMRRTRRTCCSARQWLRPSACLGGPPARRSRQTSAAQREASTPLWTRRSGRNSVSPPPWSIRTQARHHGGHQTTATLICPPPPGFPGSYWPAPIYMGVRH